MKSLARWLPVLFAMASLLSARSNAAEARAATGPNDVASEEITVFVGGYTTQENPGIRVGRFNPSTGRLHGLRLATAVHNPSFLALHPSGRVLYAVTETNDQDGRPGGGVSAFRVDPASGDLLPLNARSTRGAGPCHLAVDPSGRSLVVANYGGGSIISFALDAEGRLSPEVSFHQHHGSGPQPDRQRGPHAHGAHPDSTSRFVLVPDLGMDQILIYRLNAATAELTPHTPPYAALPPAAGPRHLAFDPAQTRAYVINELDSTVSVMEWNPQEGALKPLQHLSTLPVSFTGASTTAEIEVHPNGKFLYASNRGHDSIAVFAIHAADGTLAPAGHHSTGGRTPRHFKLDPTGNWLLVANQNSDNIVTLRVNSSTGQLGDPLPPVPTPKPSCILLVR